LKFNSLLLLVSEHNYHIKHSIQGQWIYEAWTKFLRIFQRSPFVRGKGKMKGNTFKKENSFEKQFGKFVPV